MVFDIFTLVEGFWILIPAWAANGFAPLAKFTPGRHHIDGGRTFRGKPLLGAGKTWEGLLVGVVAAILVALFEQSMFPFLPWELSEQVHGVTLNIVPMSALLGFLLGLGSMAGDITASFLKRQIGLARGRAAPILDQDDFIIGALLFASLLVAVEISWAILYLILTPAAHWIASFCGYKLKIKNEPW